MILVGHMISCDACKFSVTLVTNGVSECNSVAVVCITLALFLALSG